MYLENAIFINRAPFKQLEMSFKDNGVNILSAINGKGKTTILSHIVDAFHEMAKPYFPNSYEGKENQYYRFSSSLFHLNMSTYSLVYFRFKDGAESIDYIDCRGHITNDEYDAKITFSDKIAYAKIDNELKNNNCAKIVSDNYNKEKANTLFNTNILTYFPAYRYEQPGYLNDPYKVHLQFNVDSQFTGSLPNPIEIVSDLNQFANWLLDVILDAQLYQSNVMHRFLHDHINGIISIVLENKIKSQSRIGIGSRTAGASRVAIAKMNGEVIYPSIFNISSGESAILCIFGEILRQADKINQLTTVKGVVLIDEIDKHLHIKLQKEVLPVLFKFFPNIQFIVSSHSPFLNMGLADQPQETSQIIDLDNGGIITSPTNNDLFREVYDMMINENNRFAEKYDEIIQQIKIGTKPLIITEGKTDYKHIQKAQTVLGIPDLDLEYYQVQDSWGSSKLKEMLENLSKVKQARKIIGIFDRDEPEYLNYLESNNQSYKSYGESNVYAFAIPLVNEDQYGDKISIEHYYKRENLTKEDRNHRRLFLGDEFYIGGNSKNGKYQTRISNIQKKVNANGVIDDKVFDRDDLEFTNSIALTKDAFITLVEADSEYISDFDFSAFQNIFVIIRTIINS